MTRPAGAAWVPTAVITGASRGLGLALARFLAARGWRLVIDARDAQRLEAVGRELLGSTETSWLAGDVRSEAHRRDLVKLAGDHIDLLVNNASDLGATPLPPLVEYDLDRLREAFETNVIAPLGLIQEALPALRRAGGRIVNVTSDAARGGYPGWGGYGASKAALDLVSLTLAGELDDVCVVAVDPGDMRTAMHQAAYPGEDIGDRKLPEDTLPFWAWLLERRADQVDGRRLEAQAEVWEVSA